MGESTVDGDMHTSKEPLPLSEPSWLRPCGRLLRAVELGPVANDF